MNISDEVKKHTGTAAEIAAAINADAAFWNEISGDKVWAWLADAGRLVTLQAFEQSLNPSTDSPQVIGLKSAVRALLAALNNTLTTLDPTPGSGQRALIDAVGSALSLDVSALLAAGRPAGWTDITAEQVTAALAANTAEATRDANLATLDAAYGAALDHLDDLAAAKAAFIAAIGE